MVTFESSNFYKQTDCGFDKSKIANNVNELDQRSTMGRVGSSWDGTRPGSSPKRHFRNDTLRARKVLVESGWVRTEFGRDEDDLSSKLIGQGRDQADSFSKFLRQ